MDIKIDNNLILAPVKCGTRYLDKIWEDKMKYFTHSQFLNFPNVKYIIVRPPIEHLITALHTETLRYLNETDKVDDFYYQLTNFMSPNGATHWCVPFYEYLYYYRNRYGQDIEVVNLENLTNLLEGLGHSVKYNAEEYHFKKYEKWWSKEELFEIVKKLHPKEVNWLLEKVDEQNVYYEKLLNNEIDIKVIGKLI